MDQMYKFDDKKVVKKRGRPKKINEIVKPIKADPKEYIIMHLPNVQQT